MAAERRLRPALVDDAAACEAIYRPVVLNTCEQVGFRPGQWRDVAWFRKRLQELPAAPVTPDR